MYTLYHPQKIGTIDEAPQSNPNMEEIHTILSLLAIQ